MNQLTETEWTEEEIAVHFDRSYLRRKGNRCYLLDHGQWTRISLELYHKLNAIEGTCAICGSEIAVSDGEITRRGVLEPVE